MPRRVVGRLIACALLTGSALPLALGLHQSAAEAAGAVNYLQIGTATSVASGNVTLSLPAPSTAGNLLIATVVSDKAAAFTGPAGWTRGPNVGGTGGESEIWYYPGNPGNISSATFGNGATAFTAGQLTEWTGAGASGGLDISASAVATSGSSLTVTSATSTVAPGEVAISSFLQAGGNRLTAGTGWSQAGAVKGSSYTYASDGRVGLPKASVSETETSNKSAAWVGVIVTFEPACSTGALTLAPPGSVNLGALTLNGTDQSPTGNVGVTVDDETNAYAGWNVELTSTLLTNGGGRNLGPTAVTLTGATSAPGAGGCIAPTNSVSYPLTVPAGATPPTAAKVFDAAASTGVGPNSITLNTSLAVPATTYAGTYSATWTFTVASGP